MIYSYIGLWKMLIDEKMTKAYMRKLSDSDTNMLAKTGSDEPVSMEALAKISAALRCGFDEMVEISRKKRGLRHEKL